LRFCEEIDVDGQPADGQSPFAQPGFYVCASQVADDVATLDLEMNNGELVNATVKQGRYLVWWVPKETGFVKAFITRAPDGHIVEQGMWPARQE
jgi:hypothetical protein